PAAGTSVSSVVLSYNHDRSDGRRLIIKLNGDRYTMSIPDWELIPIARYANSENGSCVTLFGEHSTENDNHIQYHPAFINRLLGMRLLQADIIFEDVERFSQVFKYDGNYVLGTGESLPDETSSATAVKTVAYAIELFALSDPSRQPWQSYVL